MSSNKLKNYSNKMSVSAEVRKKISDSLKRAWREGKFARKQSRELKQKRSKIYWKSHWKDYICTCNDPSCGDYKISFEAFWRRKQFDQEMRLIHKRFASAKDFNIRKRNSLLSISQGEYERWTDRREKERRGRFARWKRAMFYLDNPKKVPRGGFSKELYEEAKRLKVGYIPSNVESTAESSLEELEELE